MINTPCVTDQPRLTPNENEKALGSSLVPDEAKRLFNLISEFEKLGLFF